MKQIVYYYGMDSDTRKILILAVLAVIILIVIIVFLILDPFRSGQIEEPQTVTPLPESGERTDVTPVTEPERDLPFQLSGDRTANTGQSTGAGDEPTPTDSTPPEADWRDEVVTYSTPSESPSAAYQAPTPSPTTPTDSPYTVDDLRAAGIIIDTIDYESEIALRLPPTVVIGDGYEVNTQDILDPTRFEQALNIIPDLADEVDEFQSCGRLTVPDSESAYERFLNDLSGTDEIACVAEAIVDDCEPVSVTFISREIGTLYLYAAARADGVCASGVAIDADYVDMCSITATMNSKTGRSDDFADWQEFFAKDPEEAFDILYSDSLASGVDCTLYSY